MCTTLTCKNVKNVKLMNLEKSEKGFDFNVVNN